MNTGNGSEQVFEACPIRFPFLYEKISCIYKRRDTFYKYNAIEKGVEIVRGTVSNNIENGALSYLYDIGMSITDSAYTVNTFGKDATYLMGGTECV